MVEEGERLALYPSKGGERLWLVHGELLFEDCMEVIGQGRVGDGRDGPEGVLQMGRKLCTWGTFKGWGRCPAIKAFLVSSSLKSHL